LLSVSRLGRILVTKEAELADLGKMKTSGFAAKELEAGHVILNESHTVLAGARKTTNRNTPQDNAKCYKCVDNRKGKQRVGVWKVKNKSRGGVIAQHAMNQRVNIPNTQQTSQQTIYVGMQ